ncbi:MAG: peptide deformylase [Candidatus Shapirobacteria bacterium]
MKKILVYPNKNLRIKTPEILGIDKKLLLEIRDLSKVLEKGSNAVGLAATQIGLQKRFFGIKDVESKKISIFLNPKIEKSYGEKVFPKVIKESSADAADSAEASTAKEDFLEGCLSFPNYFGTAKRYLKLDVSWQEIGKDGLVKKFKTLDAFEAIVFQHESDHLDGIVFVDHVKEDGGKFYKAVEDKMILWDVEKVVNGKL